jgi:hypothetical protein
MINISRTGSTIKITIDVDLYATKAIISEFECGNNLYAELLEMHLKKKLHETVYEVREEEYERGWKDAKHHKVKRNWFHYELKKVL